MPLVINTNVSSLNSQRQLVKSGMDLDQAMERLSSGRRVNNAADDAAGLAIANRMTSQIMGLNQSIRNANDGVSMIQTAEGALNETTNILQRMRELAIQSANGIYSDADRSTLDAEVQQLKAELDRIAESTTFNGQPLLDGSLGNVTLQVGSEAGDTIDLSISAMDTETLGNSFGGDVVGTEMIRTAASAGDLITGVGSVGSLSINGQDVGDLSAVVTMNDLLDTINAAVSGVELTSIVETTGTAAGDGVLRGTDTLTLALEDFDGNAQTYIIGETGSMAEIVAKINDVTGGVIDASLNDDGFLQITSDTAENITVSYQGGAGISNGGLAAVTYDSTLSFDITDPTVTDVEINISAGTQGGNSAAVNEGIIAAAFGLQERNDGDITGNINTAQTAISEGAIVINDVALTAITAGANSTAQAVNITAAINAQSDLHGVVATAASGVISLNSVDGTEVAIDFVGTSASFASTGLLETNVSAAAGDSVADIAVDTVTGAQDSLDIIDDALETINAIRADLGAVNNRLEFTMSNLANVVENTEAARSRIMDADFAAESAALSRAQVLQQASQAMLAQANARPQQVLQLLQG